LSLPGSPACCGADVQVGVMALVDGTDAHLEVGATKGAPSPPQIGGKGAPLGVPSLAFFSAARSGDHPHPEKRHRGHPREARCGNLSRQRSRPTAAHRRGRSPFNPRSAGERVRPSSQSEDGSDRSRARVGRGARSALAINHPSDHADGTTLGRRRRTRRPGIREPGAEQRQRPGQRQDQRPDQRPDERLDPQPIVGPAPPPARLRALRFPAASGLPRGAVFGVFLSDALRRPTAPRKTPQGAPPGGAIKASLPARKEATGVLSAWSQPPNLPPTRSRRLDDAGSPKADQKAGDEGTAPMASVRRRAGESAGPEVL